MPRTGWGKLEANLNRSRDVEIQEKEESGHNANEEARHNGNEESAHNGNEEFDQHEEVVEISPNEQPIQGVEGWVVQSIGEKWRGFKVAYKVECYDPISPVEAQIAHRPPQVLKDQWK
ncbi:hypothetical protein M9H77_18087 [Catharanthus roseus]|uniref:Uncharacterized protein n=1 Tax=Catharanthus roseus TaxID=4058 RepID=A0ACC0B6G2_CATRO|nr:hypothetical protein M9H77_18087 [Catharanthus roseus]